MVSMQHQLEYVGFTQHTKSGKERVKRVYSSIDAKQW